VSQLSEDPAATAVHELARLLFSAHSRDETLDAIARLAHQAIPGCIAASVTVPDHGKPRTAVSSAELADVLDEHQYATSEGPCLDAIRTRAHVVMPSAAEEQRWPHFTPNVQRSRVQSISSFPLVAGNEAVGALNLYSDVPNGLMGSRETAQAFAQTAAITAANAIAFDRATELSSQLAQALEHRDVIGQAKGMLMATGGLTADEAFDRLRERSQRSNRKLYDLAREMVSGEIPG
jgi:GAF domain-containing protein